MRRTIAVFLAFIPTLAFAADPPLSRIAFGSCVSQEKPQPIWEAVLAQKPELMIFLGDNIYADTDNPEVMKRKYAQFGEVPGFQKLRAMCPLMATWDDHDFGTDDCGADNPIKEASRKHFLEFFKEPSDSPRWKQPGGVYVSRLFGADGKRVQVILLDTRFNRSKLKKQGKEYIPDPDPKNTFLGEEQWKWLGEQLRVPAELRLIGTSIQVIADEHPFEKWSNFPHEKERLLNLLSETKASGVVFLSGDRHLAELSLLKPAQGYPLYDLTSSGLNMGNKRWRGIEVNSHRVATMTHGDNFGMVLVDWQSLDPVIRLQIRDIDGEVTIQQRLHLSDLQPPSAKPKAVATRPLSPGSISPMDAAAKVGEKVTIEFAVRNTGAARDKSRVFLNSAEFRDKDNFTVVLDMKKLEEGFKEAKIDDPQTHYKGKTVRVTGTVSVFRESPQIVVEEMKQIEEVK